jgi:ATP-binding cassette subfamily B protein
MESGKIVAIGTHAELMENSAIYAEIYHSQLVDDSDTPVTADLAKQEA